MMERMILGDDTGLGKTLEILSAIGYIWLKEPEYVPIIITTKSALFQWGSEVRKFMHDMEAVTVSGEPFERHAIYEEFFWRHDPAKKRLLILTYDNVMRDMDKSVVKDRSQKPSPQVKKDLAAARKTAKAVKERFDIEKTTLESHFEGKSFEVHEYIREGLIVVDANGVDALTAMKKPGDWETVDTTVLMNYVNLREDLKASEQEVVRLGNEAAPPKLVPGIIEYVQDMKRDHPSLKLMLVMDEMHKLKNHKSQFHDKVRTLSLECTRLAGMTATPVQNRLMEFWSLFRIIKPDLYPKITHFQSRFCYIRFQRIGGGRQIPVVSGYHHLDEFVRETELYYLSRKKYDVAKELPELISQEIECELSEIQEELYDMAEVGLVNKMDDADATGGEMLAALTMVQQAVDAPQLIADEEGNPFEGTSGKIDALLDLLENDADGRKTIVFSKFEKMISLVEESLKEAKYLDPEGKERKGYKYVRITGKENDPKIREKNKNLFQDPNSGVNIVLITMAGSESINLHAAEHFAFLDLPWSWGVYVQLTGRFIRIGSTHKAVSAHHFLARKRGGEKTVDHHVLKALRDKKKLADKVAGESLKGGLQFIDNDVAGDVMSLIRQAQNEKKAGEKGSLLAKANAKLAASKKQATKKPKEKVEDQPAIHAIDIDMTDI
jgi:SNF2 family DNA or RNA helicase